jgi:hypothetical protein
LVCQDPLGLGSEDTENLCSGYMAEVARLIRVTLVINVRVIFGIKDVSVVPILLSKPGKIAVDKIVDIAFFDSRFMRI